VINVVIERHILYVKQGIIRIWASYDSSEERKEVIEEMKGLDFKIDEQKESRNPKNPKNPKKIAGNYLYSRGHDRRDEKLVELRNRGCIVN